MHPLFWLNETYCHSSTLKQTAACHILILKSQEVNDHPSDNGAIENSKKERVFGAFFLGIQLNLLWHWFSIIIIKV